MKSTSTNIYPDLLIVYEELVALPIPDLEHGGHVQTAKAAITSNYDPVASTEDLRLLNMNHNYTHELCLGLHAWAR